MTRPSPPKDSPTILSRRESAPAAELFTPPVFPQPIQTMSSAGPFSPLPPMALPLRPATSNTFRVSFGNQGAGFGSPGLMESADGVLGPPTMSSSNGKRKRMPGGPKVLIPRIHPFHKATDEEVSDTIIVSQPNSISEKTDEDESEIAGKKRKIKGIMKKTQTLAAVALPSPGVERAELLFDMDRLSIENEVERSKEHLLEQQGKLGAETGIATVIMQDDEEKTDEINGGNTIPEEDEGDSGDHLKEKHTFRTVKPPHSRRRFRSPPPPPLYMDEDGEDEAGNHAPHPDPQSGEDGQVLSPPPLPPTSMIPGDDEVDGEEDLLTGTKGTFYYKLTPAERWARSQKRLQQIREYKARESREEREKRRRRRGSSSGGRTGDRKSVV